MCIEREVQVSKPECVGRQVTQLTFVCRDESHHIVFIGLDSSKASSSSRGTRLSLKVADRDSEP